MEKILSAWADDALLEAAKTDADAQYQLALLAIKNRRAGYAVALLKAAKKQKHNAAAIALADLLKQLKLAEK